MPETIFVYGTLKDKQVQRAVFGREVAGQPDSLEGYTESQIKLGRTLYPIIIPGDGSIDGFAFEVSDNELKKIDKYETDAYKRTKVTLKSGRQAWVYQKNE